MSEHRRYPKENDGSLRLAVILWKSASRGVVGCRSMHSIAAFLTVTVVNPSNFVGCNALKALTKNPCDSVSLELHCGYCLLFLMPRGYNDHAC